MAQVTEVVQAKPKVQSFTLKLEPYEARDIQTYIEQYYLKAGYGNGYAKNVGLYKTLQDGIDGKVEIVL